jgi:hypothetical protein
MAVNSKFNKGVLRQGGSRGAGGMALPVSRLDI